MKWFREMPGSGGVSAGLFVFGGVMQYVEIGREKDGSYRVRKCIDAPYDIGDASGELFAQQDKAERNFRELKRLRGGKWPASVYAGIQSKDVLLRTVELPAMEHADLKNAFRFDFDRFFPIPVEEAIYDIAPIDHPDADSSGGTAHCLAAALRKAPLENLMLAAQSVGLRFRSIEPAPVAMLRCLMGPLPPEGFSIYALAGAVSTIIIAAFRDNGVVFRNTGQSFATGSSEGAISNFARDLQSTVSFAATQLRNFSVKKVYIGGYGAINGKALQESASAVVPAPVEIVDPWTTWGIASPPAQRFGWEIPLGLALRASAEAR